MYFRDVVLTFPDKREKEPQEGYQEAPPAEQLWGN